LSITFRAWSETQRGPLLRTVLEAIGEDDPRSRHAGIKGYADSLDVLDASAVGWTDDRPRELHLTLKQRDCSWSRFAALMDVADAAESWKVARLDLNYDDRARHATPADVSDAMVAGDVVTRCDREHFDGRTVGGQLLSVYVGKLQSDRCLNVYDKDAEQAQVLRQPVAIGTHGVRWELRVKDERATTLAQTLRTLPDVDELLQTFWHAVTSLVDFRARAGASRATHHNEDLVRLPWFSALAGDAARQASYLPRAPEAEHVRWWRLERWLKSQVVATLAEYVEQADDSVVALQSLLEVGADRLQLRRDRAARTLAVA